MAGLDILEMPGPQALAVVYSLLVGESFNPAEEARSTGRLKVDAWLEENAAAAEHRAPANTAAETWGLLPEHQAGADNAMRFAGGIPGGEQG